MVGVAESGGRPRQRARIRVYGETTDAVAASWPDDARA